MTDYRMRNHDLLYADQSRRPLNWRTVTIFGTITVTVMLGVASYLTERFNPATAGFSSAPSSNVAQRPHADSFITQFAPPDPNRSGS